MEAKELMIGDLIQSDLGTIYKIKGVRDFEGGEVLVNTGKADIWYQCTLINPIPLTPEISEKNGFEEYRDGKYQLVRYRLITKTNTIIIEPMMIESRLGNNWFWLTNISREMEVVKPRLVYPFVYIHQLQRALRLCGLGEIADNFKI